MLKKLVKYGNSSALVLDKALLELLELAEGSVVKIKTDGVSLIVTPQNGQAKQVLHQTVTPEATIQEAIQKQQGTFCEKPEDAQKYMDELRAVYSNYTGIIQKLAAPESQEAMQAIAQKFNNNHLDPEYVAAVKELRKQYAPELIQMDEEIEAISQKYAKKEFHYSGNNKFVDSMLVFKAVHEKYKHVLQETVRLAENSEYINESVLLAEKYQYTKNTPEYIQEYTALISKYIPEYAAYQKELKQVGEMFNTK